MRKLFIIFCLLLLTGCQQPLGASKPAVYKFSNFNKMVKTDAKDRITAEFKNGKFKLTRWDEVSMEVGLIDDKKTSKDVELVETLGAENSDGAYELNVVLKEKPQSNVIKYSIDSAGLDFFYQPALTQIETDGGAIRPENVVGSYAVYYKNVPTNTVGGKEYKAGKAFHIYRPQIIDVNGNKVWGELNITGNLMTVTIPQDFLDKAVYPVIVDPTFGYTNIGSTASDGSSVFRCSKFITTSEAGNITSFSTYGKEYTGTYTLAQGIYSYTSDTAGTKLKADDTGVAITTTANWLQSNSVTGYSLVAGTTYWLCANETLGAETYFYYDTGDANQGAHKGATNGLPSSFSGATNSTNKFSIYVTYTASGGSTDTCNYSGSGNWNVLQSDNCYATSTVYVNGDFNLIGNTNGTGSFGCKSGVKVSATAFNLGSGKTKLDLKCFAHH
jgi:hypothetical protein